MDRLPHEFVEQILCMVCVDGGWTGSVLSSGSHCMRSATSTMRYHSVSLRGPRQIRAFLVLLIDHPQRSSNGEITRETVRTHLNPVIHVKHLFLADSQDSEYDLSGREVAWTEWDDEPTPMPVIGVLFDLIANMKRGKHTRWIEVSLKAEADINNLLSRLAPTLKYLSLHQIMHCSTHIPARFPALEELTLYSRRPAQTDPRTPISLRQWMPVLQRLHIVARKSPFPLESDHYEDLLRIQAMHDLPRSLSRVQFSDFPCPAILLSILVHSRTNAWASQTNLEIDVIMRPMELPATDHTLIRSQLERVAPGIMADIPSSGSISNWRDASPADETMALRTTIVINYKGYNEYRLHAEWLDHVQGVYRLGGHPIKLGSPWQ
jgi:hypothetical protein